MRKRFFFLFLFVCVCFGLICSGQDILVLQVQANGSVANTPDDTTLKKILESDIFAIVKVIVPLLFGSVLTLIKYFSERKCDIENIDIEIINENPVQDKKYTRFSCNRIKKNGDNIIQEKGNNPYFYDMSIKIEIPNGNKKIKNLAIKKIIMEINGYELVFFSQKGGHLGYKKCRFDRQNDVCSLLLKHPSLKAKEDKRALNPYYVYKYSQNMNIYINYFTNVNILSILNYFFPNKRTIEFGQKEYGDGKGRIGIESIRIL